MQEMLHFTQAANMLIGIGGTVKIDDPEFVPSYPATGLPGGVLPNLTVSLKKFDLLHVYNRPVASTFEVVRPRNVDLQIDNLCILGGR